MSMGTERGGVPVCLISRSGLPRAARLSSACALLAGALLLLCLGSCGPKQPGEDPGSEAVPSSDEHYPYPYHRGQDVRGDRNFAYLINNFQEGRPGGHTPWAGAWWAYKRNGNGFWGDGIAANVHGNATPAGKYDAAHCGKTHAQEWEVKYHGHEVKDAEGWWGHCNGWSTAAALFPEPREPVVVNGIVFTVADIKAILSEAAMLSSMDFFGSRMDARHTVGSMEYNDVVPDMLFLVLTNFMGKLGMPVLLDQDTGPSVWNQPLVAYRLDYPRPEDYLGVDPRAPNIHRIRLNAQLWWASDNVSDPGMLTPVFQWKSEFPFDSRRLKMELWLDGPVVFDGKRVVSSGNVIVTRVDELHHVGGAWKMEDLMFQPGYDWSHLWPDFLWVPYRIEKAVDNPDNEKEGYANPHVDIDWVKEHLLVPGGKNSDDYRGVPCAIPAPPPSPSPSPTPLPTPTRTPHVGSLL